MVDKRKLTESLGLGVGDTFMRAASIHQSLGEMPDYRSLLVKFADVLHTECGVTQIGFATLGRKNNKLHMKRKFLRLDGIKNYSAEFWAALEQEVNAAGILASTQDYGPIVFQQNQKQLTLCLIEDPKCKAGRLVVWETPESNMMSYDTFGTALLEFIVQGLQSQARWHRRLASAQSLLNIDDLTGLFNHRFLEACLENELRRADRFQNNFCLMFIDLDGFKPVNDQHGHLSGSSVLKQVGEVIRDAVREVDIAFRYGGDEFVVLLLGATSSKGILAAERVRRNIEKTAFRVEDGATIHVTASIGIASYPEHGKDKETLLRIADDSMYRSKNSGKNRVTILPPGEARIQKA